jgi:hypothetical protein
MRVYYLAREAVPLDASCDCFAGLFISFADYKGIDELTANNLAISRLNL